MELQICIYGLSIQIPQWHAHCQHCEIITRRQRAPLHPPGTKIQGGRVTSRLLILDSWMDLRSHQENGFLVVVIGPLGERNSPASPNGSSQHVKGLTFYLTPSWTWVPTPMPPGRKQLQAWLHVVWHEGHGMEKRNTGTKSPPHEPDNGAELCHIPWSPGSADSSQPTWRRPSPGSQQAPLPCMLFLILPSHRLRSLGQSL